MAGFQEMMRQWARMCHSFRCLPNGCSGCPLVHEHCYHEVPYGMDISIIESKVMAWAAEHPEPVYPTWGTWLSEKYDYDLREIMYTPIPADIAQKLGLQPKEG